MPEKITVSARVIGAGEPRQIEICRSAPVANLRAAIESEFGLQAHSLKLIFNGKVLKDTNKIETYDLKDDARIVCSKTMIPESPDAAVDSISSNLCSSYIEDRESTTRCVSDAEEKADEGASVKLTGQETEDDKSKVGGEKTGTQSDTGALKEKDSDDSSKIKVTLKIVEKSASETVSVSPSCLVEDFRSIVEEKTGYPPQFQRLIFQGKVLKDGSNLESYQVTDGKAVHVMRTSMPAPSRNTSAASLSSVSATRTTSNASSAASTMPASISSAALPQMPMHTDSTQIPRAAQIPGVPSTPSAVQEAPPALRLSLQSLRSTCSDAQYRDALSTLQKIIKNIADHPNEERYRRINKENAAFRRKLGGFSGGLQSMAALGFVPSPSEPGYLILSATAEAWTTLMKCKVAIDSELVSAARAPVPAPPPLQPLAGGFPSGGAGLGPGLGGAFPPSPSPAGLGGMDPDQLASMLQNPTVQQMVRNHPALRQSGGAALEQMLQNPQMAAAALRQLQQNPAMAQAAMQQAQRMMGTDASSGVGGLPGLGASWGGASVPGGAQPAAANPFASGNTSTTPSSLSGAVQPAPMANYSSTSAGGSLGSSTPLTGGPQSIPQYSNAQQQTSSATAATPQQQQQEGNMPSTAMSEEEMLEEAIRRSLQEQ